LEGRQHLPAPKARRTQRRIACGRTARCPVTCIGRGKIDREKPMDTELRHQSDKRWVVLSIILEAVPAWLCCRFSRASMCCSLLPN